MSTSPTAIPVDVTMSCSTHLDAPNSMLISDTAPSEHQTTSVRLVPVSGFVVWWRLHDNVDCCHGNVRRICYYGNAIAVSSSLETGFVDAPDRAEDSVAISEGAAEIHGIISKRMRWRERSYVRTTHRCTCYRTSTTDLFNGATTWLDVSLYSEHVYTIHLCRPNNVCNRTPKYMF